MYKWSIFISLFIFIVLEFCVDFGDCFFEVVVVVAGCTCGWWYRTVLVYGCGFDTVLCLYLCMVVGFYFVYIFYIDGFFLIFLYIIFMYRIKKLKKVINYKL